MRRAYIITFKKISELPSRHDVGDATVLLNGADDDFSHQFAIAAYQQFTILQHTLFVTDVQHHKIPLRIHHHNLAFEASGQDG